MMAGDELETGKKQRNWLVIGAGIAATMFLCLCAGAVGFGVAGYFILSDADSAVTTPERVTEIVEVTREVTVEANAAQSQEPAPPELNDAQASEGDTGSGVEENGNAAELETAVPLPNTAQSAEPYTNIESIDMDLLYEVWDLVEENFDGDLPPEDAIINALVSGSLNTLDDNYTRYIVPEVATRIREDLGGSVSGIGAFVEENEDGLVQIVAPIEGQPADFAGLLPRDIVIGVDGQNVVGISFDEVLLMIRGPEGTDVTLEIVREDEEEPLFFTITRTRYEVPVVNYELLEGNIAYIQLLEFNQVATENILEALDVLLAQNPRGLILDLRNNPGGFLNQSISVSDLFLPEAVVLLERNNQGLDQTFRADTGDVAEKIPMVLLVNEGSASASEIVAGALQDNGRATIIGQTTFGKGSVQNVFELSNGGELRVTIARFYTPNNFGISGNGVTPDIEVEMDLEVEFGSTEDVQLQRALEFLRDGN